MDSDGYESDTMSPTEINHTSNSQSSEKNYTILTEFDIRKRQYDAVSHISSVLSLNLHEASRLLCFYKWEISHLHDHWFSDEQAVRNKVGLSTIENREIKSNCNEIKQCGICFDDFESRNSISIPCNHAYCRSCWESYIRTAIDDGPCCLFLSCPECKTGVTRDIIESIVEKEYVEKYDNFFVKSYVDCKKEKIKWCPAPNCEYAIEFDLYGDDDNDDINCGFDVNCECSHGFCWNCVEEIHRPVECELVRMWILKNTSEAENTKWILAFTKPCPKCKRPIEKNHGCNHMTCSSPCKFQFCWLCLKDWTTHNLSYSCNAYKDSGLDDKERKNAQKSLKRYRHYYERWASNHKSRQKAIQDLHNVEKNVLHTLSTMVNKPTTELEFVLEAWKQIIESRRVLKWSYTYGYYMTEKEPSKQPFFEYLQGQAEGVLEKLHGCAENELSVFLNIDNSNNDNLNGLYFKDYRSKLVNLTKVCGRHFEDLVRALENGLSEVAVVTPNLDPKKGKKRKGSASSSQPRRVNVVERNVNNNDDEVGVNNEDVGGDMVVSDFWTCDQCTYNNPLSATSCQMCFDGY